MINIINKEDCVGCNACVQRCPRQCISMSADEQGFLYPKVDASLCIECGLCEKVCPVINQADAREPIAVYAARNNDPEIVRTSSSGGIFYALAKYIIDEGGVVFGARFNDDWEVIHDWTETVDGLKAFQGSKYVQSRIGECYIKAEQFLKQGRKVLFSGTPCQLAGLRLFLRKDYGDLLHSIDVVCHGVPSPLVWKDYLQYISLPKGATAGKNTVLSSLNVKPTIVGISFRDKRLGWEKYGFAVRYATTEGSGINSVLQPAIRKSSDENIQLIEDYEPFSKNIFMQGFLKDLYLRPSCYKCPAKCGKSHSDITMADFWGIKNHYPELYSEKGVSLVQVNSDYGIEIVKNVEFIIHEVSYLDALSGNLSIIRSVFKPKQYLLFWREYYKCGISAIQKVLIKIKLEQLQRIPQRIVLKLFRIFKNI